MTEYPKFSDFATDDKKLDGGKVKLKDILNQELIVLNYAIHRSKMSSIGWLKHCNSHHLVKKLILDDSGLISLIASHAERLGIHNPLEDVVRRSSW